MEFHPVAHTLLTFITLITGLSALGWTLMATPLKIAPKASQYFALANAFILLGLVITINRTSSASYFYWFFADQCVLLGFVLMQRGMIRLFKLPDSNNVIWYCWGGVALIMLIFTPSSQSEVQLGVLFSVGAFTSLFLLALSVYRGIESSFGHQAAFLISLPSIIIALFFLFRGALLLFVPNESLSFAGINSEEAIPALWFYAVLNLLANITMFACALARLTSKVRLLSERDQLTELLNRRAIQRKLTVLHESWLASGSTYGVILFDIDNFKNINDEFGHHLGDRALVSVSEAIKNGLPEPILASRYGGEEFLLVLPNATIDTCLDTAKQLKAILSEVNLTSDNGSVIPLTASFGCAVIVEGCSIERLILLADKAMYEVKANGRNGIASINGLVS